MYNKITPEMLVVILGVAFVCLLVGLIATGINQYFYPKQSKSQEQSEHANQVKRRKFRVTIDATTYVIQCNDILDNENGYVVKILGESDKTILSKMKNKIQDLCDIHAMYGPKILEKVIDKIKLNGMITFKYEKTKMCEELERMFGN